MGKIRRYWYTNSGVEEAYREGKKLMGRSEKRLGVLTPGGAEDVRFRSFFGAGVVVVLTAWHGMAEHDLLPDGLGFQHYLWALLFMAVYPKSEAALCAHLGGRDPKTVREKTWPFIFALDELSYHVVSCKLFFIHWCKEQVTLTSAKILFSNRFRSDTGNDAILSVDGADF